MPRYKTKIGDIFSINIDGLNKRYLQLIAFDLAQLNSDVIRIFSEIYPCGTNDDIEEIANGNVEFYAHTITKFGLQMGYWESVGTSANIGTTANILFRNTSDYGTRPGEQIKTSDNWYIWKINDTDFTKVGKLDGTNRKAEIGIVVSPDSIVHRIKTGQYDFVYPDYE